VLFIPFISLYAIAEHEGGMIDMALAKANIDPTKIPPNRLDEVLTKLGIDPKRVPETVKRKFKMKSTAASAPASKDVGELMVDAAVVPKATTEEAGEDPDAYHFDDNGNIVPDLPEEEWELSAILVQSRGGYFAQMLIYNFKVVDDRASAVNPATEMRLFFDTFLAGSTQILLIISAFVTVVAGASIMTTIYNSVSARLREIAILRALGATRVRILSLICAEAVLVGLIGGVLGIIVGHALSAAGSVFLNKTMGESINWLTVGKGEIWYLLAVCVMALLAGLVPAMKAYRTPVANNLVAA